MCASRPNVCKRCALLPTSIAPCAACGRVFLTAPCTIAIGCVYTIVLIAFLLGAQALKINDKHAKAIYRRGQICLALNDLDAAERDLVAAQQSFPKDAGVQSDLATLKHKMKQSEQRQRQQFAGMFDSATKQTPHPAVEERPSASSDA